MMSPTSAFRILLTRKFGAFLMLMFTANPVTWSYLPWIMETGMRDNFEVKAFIGICLILGYYAYLRATMTSIGVLGAGAVAVLCGLVVVKLAREEIIDLTNPDTLSWVGIIIGAMAMGFGMGWSIIRLRVSGQVDPNV